MARTDDTGDKTTFQVDLMRPLAGFCGGLVVLTIVWPDWIEALTAYDPDQHAGSVEWLMVVARLSTGPYWRSRRAPNGVDRGPRLSSLD
jgi:hypothetical protein